MVTLLVIVIFLLLDRSTITFPVNDEMPSAILLHSVTVAPPLAVQAMDPKLTLPLIVVGLEVHVFWAFEKVAVTTKNVNARKNRKDGL